MHSLNGTRQGTVPQSVISFLESGPYEDAIRKAVPVGGGSDTLGAVAGGNTQAFYVGAPKDMAEKAPEPLDDGLRGITDEFTDRFRPGC